MKRPEVHRLPLYDTSNTPQSDYTKKDFLSTSLIGEVPATKVFRGVISKKPELQPYIKL